MAIVEQQMTTTTAWCCPQILDDKGGRSDTSHLQNKKGKRETKTKRRKIAGRSQIQHPNNYSGDAGVGIRNADHHSIDMHNTNIRTKKPWHQQI
jgi:hypothetical protein